MNFAIDIGHAHGTGSHGHGLDEHAVATHVAALLKNHLTAAGHSVTLIDYPHISNEADLAMAHYVDKNCIFDWQMGVIRVQLIEYETAWE